MKKQILYWTMVIVLNICFCVWLVSAYSIVEDLKNLNAWLVFVALPSMMFLADYFLGVTWDVDPSLKKHNLKSATRIK